MEMVVVRVLDNRKTKKGGWCSVCVCGGAGVAI